MRNILLIIGFLFPAIVMSQIFWAEHEVEDYFGGANSVFAADINGDGDLDVLGTAYDIDEIVWWENVDSLGLIWDKHVIDEFFFGANDVHAVDVDGDGDIDVLGSAGELYRFVWWENLNGSGLSWTRRIVGGFGGVSSVRGADIDGDGDTDVLGADGSTDRVAWWENLGGNGLAWDYHRIYRNFGGAGSAEAPDIDGDGDLDIIAAASFDDIIAWGENVDGSGLNWSGHTLSDNQGQPNSVFAADVDGDGDLDILSAEYSDHDITWWENSDGGGQTWIEHIIDGAFINPICVHAADLTGDGHTDVLGISYSGIYWWNNLDGHGLTWQEHAFSSFGLQEESDVYAADIDNDGDVDVIGCAEGSGGGYGSGVIWWENLGSLSVRSPLGGEGWRLNTPHDIKWLSSYEENVRIELLDSDEVVEVITEDTENDSLFRWVVPQDLVPGNNYRVRISLLSGEDQDASDIPFSIPGSPTVSINPTIFPIVIQPHGGGFWYWTETTNPSPFPGTGHYWTEVILPDGTTFGPLGRTTVSLDPFETLAPSDPFSQFVPDYAPPGIYQFVIHVGIYPTAILASDSFEFEKLASVRMEYHPEITWSVEDWQNSENGFGNTDRDADELISLPTDYNISHAHPNPFNSFTSFSVSLPEPADLRVVVYNVRGQVVAELANGPHGAGNHALTFDASNISSGLYFVRSEVHGQLNHMQKIVLMK
jgi:FG-GAP-like repeat/Secretion system C-terminal sorting domain